MPTRPSSSRARRKLSLKARARRIRLVLMDVDGVLTDGRIYYLPNLSGPAASDAPPFAETKTFHSRDGLGIRLARDAGLKIGIISGRGSPVVEYRARELGIEFLRQDARFKLGPYREILKEAGLGDREVCYIGDDLVDLPILIRAGLAVGVSDGHPLLRSYVHYVTRAPGGLGAVRETIELILSAQGKLKRALDGFLDLDG
ncbi:MAG TPA: HAD family hydrolase [Terriglobia bacterium]|nr:HAD family hydrolase [Terriglobia bacterium]